MSIQRPTVPIDPEERARAPSRSAFLTGLSVVLVPLLGRALGRPLRPGPLAGALCAAAGLWMLYRPGAGAAESAAAGGFGRGVGSMQC